MHSRRRGPALPPPVGTLAALSPMVRHGSPDSTHRRRKSSLAASWRMFCPIASLASGTMGCSPIAARKNAWQGCVVCWALTRRQSHGRNRPKPPPGGCKPSWASIRTAAPTAAGCLWASDCLPPPTLGGQWLHPPVVRRLGTHRN
jgi:hypothetical protein